METSNSEITTLADAAAADAKPEDAKVEGSEPSAPKAGTSEDTSSWTEKAQKRYDELTRKAYEAQGERDRERYQREALQSQLDELKKAKTEPVAPEQFPTLEQFGYDEGKFHAAVSAYNKATTDAGREAAREAAREEIRAERDAESRNQAAKSWATKEAEFIKSKPDYVDKVQRAAGLPISAEIQRELLGSELGPQVAYYLVDNRDKALAIKAMPLAAQLREIGRIEAKLEPAKVPPKPLVSQAPPPVSKVDSAEGSLAGISTTHSDSDKLSDDAWVKAENARLRRKSKAGV